MRATVFPILLLLVLPLQITAQELPEYESVFDDYLNPASTGYFLNIPGLSFNSSVGFSFLSSGSGFSAGYGYYIGHFRLNLTDNLTLRWDLGLRSMVSGPELSRSPEFFIPNIDLTYRKSENFTVRLQFQQMRYPYYYRGMFR